MFAKRCRILHTSRIRKRRHKDPSCVRAPSVGLVIVVPHCKAHPTRRCGASGNSSCSNRLSIKISIMAKGPQFTISLKISLNPVHTVQSISNSTLKGSTYEIVLRDVSRGYIATMDSVTEEAVAIAIVAEDKKLSKKTRSCSTR